MFGNRKLTTSISVTINKEALHRVEVTRCLGILIDDKLTWKNHISLTKSKLSKCCTIMYRACIMIDRCGLSVLHHSLFCLILCTVLKYGATLMLQILSV